MKHIIALGLFCLPAFAQAASSIQLTSAPEAQDTLARTFTVTLDAPAAISLSCLERGNSRERHQLTSEEAASHALIFRGLKARTTYVCQAAPLAQSKLRSNPVTFTTDPLPADLAPPRIVVPSSDPAATGYVLYDRSVLLPPWNLTARYLVIADAEGNVRWYLPGLGGGIDTSYLGNDRILYSGIDTTTRRATVVGLDKLVKYQPTSVQANAYEVTGSYNHDSGLSSDGRSIYSMTKDKLDTWKGFVIRQVDIETDTLIWSWDSILDGYLEGYLPAGSSSTPDPYHANSVWDQWEDGRLYLYVSLYAQWSVLKIDVETKDIVWQMGPEGDFELLEANGTPADPSRWFIGQHDAQMRGNRLSLYDNGTTRNAYYGVPNYSRVLELDVDEQNLQARIAFEYTEPDWVEPICGGYDLLPNGHRLIAMSHAEVLESPPHNSALVELDTDGQVVWRAELASIDEFLYRGEHIDGCAIFNNLRYCPR